MQFSRILVSFLMTHCLSTIVAGSEKNFEIIDVGIPCNKEVSLFKMFGSSIHAGELKIYWHKTFIRSKQDEPCDLMIRGYYLFDRLAFQFTNAELDPDDCIELKQRDRFRNRDLYVDISTDYGYSSKYCGPSLPINTIFTTYAEYDLILRFVQGSTGYKTLRMAFNVFHLNECEDYLCENGRCIPDDIQCNKNNPCGDHTECKNLTGWEIFGIVAGCVAGLVLLCCCCCCCYYMSKKDSSDNETTGTIQNNARIGQESYPLNERGNAEELTGLTMRQLDEGHNTTPVYVYATVSNQNHFDSPPTYTSVSSDSIQPTASGQYPMSSYGERGISTGNPYTSGQYAANYSAHTAPTAPSIENEDGPPPPPSYDDVIAHEEKYKVS